MTLATVDMLNKQTIETMSTQLLALNAIKVTGGALLIMTPK